MENFPRKGPVVIAANHLSYLDFLLLGVSLPRSIHFLVKDVFFKNWLYAIVLKGTGQIKVTKGDKSSIYAGADKVLLGGDVLGIFPEGTRSNTGFIQKAYKGVAKIAQKNGADIVPIVIRGSNHVWGRDRKRPKFRRVCEVKILHPIYYSDVAHISSSKVVHDILMPEIARELGQDYPG